MSTTIALVDDHVLLRNGLAGLVTELGYDVLFQADNGEDFIQKLSGSDRVPELALMDINMPKMDGYATTAWLRSNHPDVKVLALSMYDDENSVLRMIKSGARGYILKDTDPTELQTALAELTKKGFYHSDLVTGKLIHNLRDDSVTGGMKELLKLTPREVEFLKLSCSEMPYREIAEQMAVSPRTVDGYRDELFEKLNVKSRVGLVIFAIKYNVVDLHDL